MRARHICKVDTRAHEGEIEWPQRVHPSALEVEKVLTRVGCCGGGLRAEPQQQSARCSGTTRPHGRVVRIVTAARAWELVTVGRYVRGSTLQALRPSYPGTVSVHRELPALPGAHR